jgi:hypothetical protein
MPEGRDDALALFRKIDRRLQRLPEQRRGERRQWSSPASALADIGLIPRRRAPTLARLGVGPRRQGNGMFEGETAPHLLREK